LKRIGVFDGDFANFAGFHGGWLIDLSFLIGMAGYGTFVDWKWAMVGCFSSTSSTSTSSSTIHPRFDWRRGADNYGNRHHGPGHDVDGFFVAEPEARVTLNVLKPFRIGFGLGYRFVGGCAPPSHVWTP